MARCLVFGVVQNFIEWPWWQPFMVMHELGHAWHYQVLGNNYQPIQEAYRRAVQSKTYDEVLHIQGETKRHYGMNNAQEYFAESTEAFFGINDFYPFVRPELLRHDPTGARVVEEAWNVAPK